MKLMQPLALIGALALICGCTGKRVLFTTHTSLGLDVSGTAEVPNKIAFAYKRAEGAIVPAKVGDDGKRGEAHSVYGGLDSDTRFFTGQILKQTFATGEAAVIATKSDADIDTADKRNQILTNLAAEACPENPAPAPPNRPALIFLTGTTYGLNIHVGGEQSPPNLVVGYRRSENAFIPIHDPTREVNSVYADLLINTMERGKAPNTPITTNFSSIAGGGVRLKQSFATGKAAKQVAFNANAQQRLGEAAGLKATQDRVEDRRIRGKALADEAETVLTRVPDDRLDVVGELAISKRLLAGTEADFNAKAAAAKRAEILAAIRGGPTGRSAEREVAAVADLVALLRLLSN